MKTAVVTASTKGIGKAVAKRLLLEGYFVILNYAKDDISAKELELEFTPQYEGYFALIKQELSSYDSIEKFTSACLRISPQIDCLVLNAGITSRKSFDSMDYDTWKKVLDTNLNIPFFLIQKMKDHLRRRASILLVGSILGIYPHSVSIPYGVSKAASNFLAKTLVKEFTQEEITINSINPGFVDTDWQLAKTQEMRERIEQKIALGRFALPEEIADMCIAIIHNQYMNGSVINVDGGYAYQ